MDGEKKTSVEVFKHEKTEKQKSAKKQLLFNIVISIVIAGVALLILYLVLETELFYDYLVVWLVIAALSLIGGIVNAVISYFREWPTNEDNEVHFVDNHVVYRRMTAYITHKDVFCIDYHINKIDRVRQSKSGAINIRGEVIARHSYDEVGSVHHERKRNGLVIESGFIDMDGIMKRLEAMQKAQDEG